MEYVAPAVVLSLALVAVALILRRVLIEVTSRRAESAAMPLAELQGRLDAGLDRTAERVEALNRSLQESVQALSGQLGRALSDTNRTVGDRLDTAAKVLGDLRQQLGQLDASSRQMAELGRDIARLQDILLPPKLRGGLGELFLADLLAQVLPARHYELQHRFRGGETVDAVIQLKSGLVPIDAKFPLEGLRRILAAADEEQRKAARRQFVRDVKTHVDAIASKYIRLDENTFDFALMYIPAENVYYETIIRDDETGGEPSLLGYAMSRRVIPVSPSTFYSYLQTIVLGLKGMRVEEESRAILNQLARLEKDFGSFSEAFRVLGQHLDNSVKRFVEANTRLGKVEARFDQVAGLAQGLAGDAPATGSEPAGGGAQT